MWQTHVLSALEYEAYKDFKQRAPKCGTPCDTPTGQGKVVSLNTPKETVTVRMPDGSQMTVPLESIDCSAGKGCPCMLKAEALEVPEPMFFEPVVISMPAPAVAASKADDAETSDNKRRRSRRSRNRKPAGERGAEQQAQEAPRSQKPATRQGSKQQPARGGSQAEAKPVGEGTSTSARRRRRRRPSSGGQGQAADKAE